MSKSEMSVLTFMSADGYFSFMYVRVLYLYNIKRGG